METLAATYYSYSYSPSGAGALGGILAMSLGMILLSVIISLVVSFLINMALTWGVYKKGGYKGFEGAIPFYGQWCLVKMAGLEPVWFIIGIFFAPIYIYIYIKLAEKFGKSAGYGVGLALLPIVFFPMLGYGDARYYGPNAQPMNGNMNGQNNGYGPVNGQPMNNGYAQPMNGYGQPMNNGYDQPMNGQPMNNGYGPMNGQPMNGQPMDNSNNNPDNNSGDNAKEDSDKKQDNEEKKENN